VSDGDAVAVAHECCSSPVADAASPLGSEPVGSQTAWLPVPLRSSLRATANRCQPQPPAPNSRGPCPAIRNCARSVAAAAQLQPHPQDFLRFPHGHSPCRHSVLLIDGVSLPGNCPASLPPTAARLWKTFRSKLNTIPVDEQNCSPSHRNGVHLQTGMLFGITTEWCSASDPNRVHLRPDSPSGPCRMALPLLCPVLARTDAVRRRLTLFPFWHDPTHRRQWSISCVGQELIIDSVGVSPFRSALLRDAGLNDRSTEALGARARTF
jgi:hypothetical protein